MCYFFLVLLVALLFLSCRYWFYWRKKQGELFGAVWYYHLKNKDLSTKLEFFSRIDLRLLAYELDDGRVIEVDVPSHLKSLDVLKISCEGIDSTMSLQEAIDREVITMEWIEGIVDAAIEEYGNSGRWSG